MYKNYIKHDPDSMIYDYFQDWQTDHFDSEEQFVEDTNDRGYFLQLRNDLGYLQLQWTEGGIVQLTEQETIDQLSDEEWLDVVVRPWRKIQFDCSIWIFERQETGHAASKMPTTEFNEWLDYWQDLRDLPATIDRQNPVFVSCPDHSLMVGN